MNCLIIDNNPAERNRLSQHVSEIKAIDSCIECCSTVEAYNYIYNHTVDIVFIEVEMPKINGLDFVKNLSSLRPAIIFTSAKNEYAIEAFELQVADYLLKPFRLERTIQAVTKAKQSIRDREIKQKQEDFIFIKDSNTIKRLRINDILYAEAMGDYVKLFTTDKYHAIHTKFATVESRLPADKFLRIHRSFIVALDKIDSLRDRELMVNGKCLPVAITYKQILSERMNILA